MHKFVTICLVLLCVYNNTVAKVLVRQWQTIDPQLGPIVNIFCKSGGSASYSWIFNNQIIALDNDILGADPTKYSVKVGYISQTDYGSLLLIKNALIDYVGYYKCQIDYHSTGNQPNRLSDKIYVDEFHYLPPLTYPKCHVGPSTTLNDASTAAFNCTAGKSSASLNLLLTLQYQNGSIVELGHDAVTKTVTLNDNNATFICHMTSKTFPTAYRNCSTGPITVLQTSSLATTQQSRLQTSSKNTKTIPTFVSSPIKGQNSNDTGSSKMYFIYGIIVGSTGAFLLVVLIGAIICVITLRKSKLEENNPVRMPSIRNGYGDRNQPNQEVSSDVTSRQDNSEQTEVYAEIQEPISQNVRGDTITYADTDVNLLSITEETVTFPLYSEVQDAEEDDISNNEDDDEDSARMVENTIYVSSGPV